MDAAEGESVEFLAKIREKEKEVRERERERESKSHKTKPGERTEEIDKQQGVLKGRLELHC